MMGKSKHSRWHLVHAILGLVLIGFSLATPLMEPQTAWAAPQVHLAPASPNQVQLPKPGGGPTSSFCQQQGKQVATHDCRITSQTQTDGCTSNCFFYSGNTLDCINCYDSYHNAKCVANCSKPPPTSQQPQECSIDKNGQLVPASCDTPGALHVKACYGVHTIEIFCIMGDLKNSLGDLVKTVTDVVFALFKYDFIGWITCMLTAGIVPCPTVSGTPWSFDCPIVDQNNNVIDATSNETIYEAAIKSQGTSVKTDWLSGDATKPDINAAPSATQSEPGHLIYTYPADTTSQPNVTGLSSYSLMIALTMIGPLFALAGFQLLLAGVQMRSQSAWANAMDTLGRVLLAAAIVGLSFYMIQMFLDLTNSLNSAIAGMYANASLSYNTAQTQNSAITGSSGIGFSIPGDSPGSMRALVVPMSLWGCIMDDFIALMTSRLANMIGSTMPVVGGVFGILGRVTEVLELVRDLGEFGLLILSATIWGQAIARIILLNYYIIMAPIALACSALPGQMGGQVLRAWFKGFLQLLFMQPLQLFILVSMPSLMPDFGKMQFPTSSATGSIIQGPLQALLSQVPPLIILVAAVGAPKVMMGMGPMKTVMQAGALTGKAVATAGTALNHMIKK